MRIRIQSFSFHASDELIGHAESTLTRLSQFSSQIKEAHVTLTIDPSGPIELKVCEVRLGLHGYHLFASEQCQSFEEAILKASGALKQRLMYCESGDGSDVSRSYRTAS